MKKSFTFGEAVGLTPCPLSAVRLPSTQPSVAERPSASLRAAPRGEELKEAGGRRPPASFKTSPLPRLDSLLRRVTLAGGEVRGGGESLAHSSGSRGAAMKVQVESSPDGISLRTFDTPH